VSFYGAERLYELLPAVYRQRDADLGYPLRDLVALLAREGEIVEADLERLYESWFIETAPEWAVPYIGDLIGVRGLADAGFSRRAEVANTIGYRRRKGTAAVLEQLARDVTGWPARVVEYFELLGWTQYANHLRPHAVRTPDLRRPLALERLDGPFDSAGHSGEVRRIPPLRGRFNIPNVGLWLWRLGAYPLGRATAREVPDGTGRHFTFSPLGHDAPLFHLPLTETGPGSIAQPENVPEPIGRRTMLAALETYYGDGKSVAVERDGALLAPAEVEVCNLEAWVNEPPAGKRVGIDPVLGRLAFAPAEAPPAAVRVGFHYGFAADLGGGAYERAASFTAIAGESAFAVGERQPFATLSAALGGWIAAGRPSAVITVHDSRSYEETPAIDLPAGVRLELRAANEERPALLLAGELVVTAGEGSGLEINGLAIAGGAVRCTGRLDRLTLRHATLAPAHGFDPATGAPLAPGTPSLIVDSDEAEISIERSILGPVEIAVEAEAAITDSILDASNAGRDFAAAPAYSAPGGGPGGALTIARSTVAGTVETRVLALGENSLFLSTVTAERRQEGCVRFSFVTPESRVPRRYRCQPVIPESATPAQLAALTARVRPRFETLAFGRPAYAQLSRRGPVEIFRGADDESEMGVFSHLKQPQRLDNLRARLDEYLRVGLEAGIFCAT
jgi:hypothetical protein